MTKQQAERWVRLAWILGALSGCVFLSFVFASSLVSTSSSPVDVVLLWLLAFGIYCRSRVAAVLMVGYQIASVFVLRDVALLANPVYVMGFILRTLVYVQGARGTFALSPQSPAGQPTALVRAADGDLTVGDRPPSATASDRHEPSASLETASASAVGKLAPEDSAIICDRILALVRRRKVQYLAIVLFLGAVLMYGLRGSTLGLPAFIIVFLLVYQSVRGNVIILWLRRFHEPSSRGSNFGKWLAGACVLLATPITVQDSSFKFDRNATMMKTAFVPGTCIALIGRSLLASDRIHDWVVEDLGVWPFITLITSVSLAIFALLYRRAGYFAVSIEEAEKYTRRLVGKIEGRTGWFAPGVTTIRCADSCWREAVEVCMEHSAVAVIDVTTLSENIIWELQAAFRLLPPQCIILAYAVEPNENEATTASVMHELRTGLRMELPANIQMFPYPAIANSWVSWWLPMRSTTHAFRQLIVSSLAQSPRAETLRASVWAR